MSQTQQTDAIKTILLRNRRVVFAESILALLLAWELASRLFDLMELISSPYIVGIAAYEVIVSGELAPHFFASMERILLGFTAAIIVGTIGGIALGVSGFWGKVLRYYVLVGMAVPGLFVVIFVAMAFGLSSTTPMISTAIITAPFIMDIIQSGVEDIDSELLNMSSAFNISRLRVYRRMLFPAILPEVFASIRFSFSVAWKVAVLAEVVISNVGIGFLIRENMNRLSMVGVLKYVTVFVIVMMLIEYGVFQKIESYLFDWREDVQSSIGGTR